METFLTIFSALLAIVFVNPTRQVRVPGPGGASALAVVTPALVNFRGMPSNEGVTLATKTNNTCASFAYCTQLVDSSVSGNTIIVFYTYTFASSQPPTVTDDKSGGSSTYSCVTEAHDGSTNNGFAGICYSINVASGIRNITVTWPGTTGATSVAVAAMQVYNVASFDVACHNGTQTATTTYSCGAMTTTANGDLVCNLVVGTTTRTLVSAFTVGSGFTMHLADRRDAAAIQCEVQSSAGSITPTMTGQSNGYVSVGAAFKAGASGTAPSGMYIAHLYTVSSASGGSANLAYQVPVSGNLVVGMAQGGVMTPTAVSDTTNGTWSNCGPIISALASASTYAQTYYSPNSAAGVLPVTVTVAGTGDIGPMAFYDIAGAATAQECGRLSAPANITATASTYASLTTSYVPSASSGIMLFAQPILDNTLIGVTVPSGGVFDIATTGGQSLNGPSLPDQNNGQGHAAFSSNAAVGLTWSLSSSSQAINTTSVEAVAFQASGATVNPIAVGRASANHTSGTTAVISNYKPSFSSSSILAAMACTLATTGTITVSDTTNGSWTAVDGPTNLNGVRCKTFWIANTTASTITSITATFGTTAGFNDIMMEEFHHVTALDKHNLVAVTAGTNGIYSGTATATTATANEVVFAGFICGTTCALPDATSIPGGVNLAPWTFDVQDGGGNTAAFLALGSTQAVTAKALDFGGSGNLGVSSVMTFQ